jgi:hypothetical protein
MATKKRKRRPLSVNDKRRKLMRGLAMGMNITEAGRSAGYGTPQAAHRAVKQIRLGAPELLDLVGLPAEKVLRETFLPATKAMETKFFSHQCIVLEKREVINHDIRPRAGIELAKMHGLYPKTNGHNEEDADSGEGTTIYFNLGFLDPARTEAVLAAARE